MGEFFTAAEIAWITGLERPAAQERFLAKQGIKVMRSRNNEVILSRSDFVKWQLGQSSEITKDDLDIPLENFSTSHSKHPVYEGMTPANWFKKSAGSLILKQEEIISKSEFWEDSKPPQKPGIYFLYRENELQYIGQAVNIYARLWQHVRNGRQFDRWSLVLCPILFLNDVENAYLSWLLPPENVKLPFAPGSLARKAISGAIFKGKKSKLST